MSGRGATPGRAAAIAQATGVAWDEWAEVLDSAGGVDLPHKTLAETAYAAMPLSVENAGWWAQSVAVAYEQWIGRRVPGQAHDGTFQVSATRTVPGSMEEVFDRWCRLVGEPAELDGLAVTDGPRTSGTDKRLHWGVTLADGSRGNVDVSPKGADKVLVAASQVNLSNPDEVERWRSVWKQQLKHL
ncbi:MULTISPECIES: hypothetical protein [Kocuria]|uniref:DUF4287 domain-containing protein n=1 Tax=Kocuria subflava TaxID=1736139 RepID=A0A846TGW9_9MICC|nr:MULTISPECIES: hypothetical protein [Kocuria]NKE08368.1 hypothetical protein [Kocuria subflava]